MTILKKGSISQIYQFKFPIIIIAHNHLRAIQIFLLEFKNICQNFSLEKNYNQVIPT